ncbi:MAG: hemerythrin domain-containing protein [Ginsengibacter sp.]
MEVKPIKRNKNIAWLSKDHHFGLLACWKINRGIALNIETERIRKYIQFFWEKHLDQHFKEEELFLFDAMSDDKIGTAIEQHKNIRDKIKSFYENDCADTFVLQQFAEELNDHIRYEERILFPFLEKALSENRLQNIGAALEGNHADSYIENYGDEFWIAQ